MWPASTAILYWKRTSCGRRLARARLGNLVFTQKYKSRQANGAPPVTALLQQIGRSTKEKTKEHQNGLQSRGENGHSKNILVLFLVS